MLKIVESTTIRNNFKDVLNEIISNKDYMLITRNKKPISALVNLDLFEDLLALITSVRDKLDITY